MDHLRPRLPAVAARYVFWRASEVVWVVRWSPMTPRESLAPNLVCIGRRAPDVVPVP